MPEVTYRRLDEVLRSLGFSVQEPEEGTRLYRHARSGALIVLPALPEHDEVLPRHLVGVRMTLDAFGIADPPEFASRLQKAS
jgi:hypothetical protein